MIKATVLAGLLSLTSLDLLANWTVNNEQSTVSFISVKKSNVMEAHHFNQLTGQLTKDGKFSLNIDLSSVDTGITVRNERMQEHLFEQAKFANATVSASLKQDTISKLKVNETTPVSLKAELNLHGYKKSIRLLLDVVKLSDSSLIVSSKKTVFIKANDFSLVKGIEKLRELARLPSIATTVPVSFSLRLNKE